MAPVRKNINKLLKELDEYWRKERRAFATAAANTVDGNMTAITKGVNLGSSSNAWGSIYVNDDLAICGTLEDSAYRLKKKSFPKVRKIDPIKLLEVE